MSGVRGKNRNGARGRFADRRPNPNITLVKRICLKCRGEFMSFGNRICALCTVENTQKAKRTGSIDSGKRRSGRGAYEA